MPKQYVITVTSKKGTEVYATLQDVVKDYPALNVDTVNYWLSRKRQPFKNQHITIDRKPIIRNSDLN